MEKDEHILLANTLVEYIKNYGSENVPWQDVGCDAFYSTAVCCLCTLNPIFDAEVDTILTDFETGSQDDLVCQTQYGPVRMNKEKEATYVSLLEEEMHVENEVFRQDTEGDK